VRINDLLDIDNGSTQWQVRVLGVSDKRGPATSARQLYSETDDSVRRRDAQSEQRKLFTEPSETLRGRPTKRDRRHLDRSRE
jgi:ribosome-associated heat shock protein Hsp15